MEAVADNQRESQRKHVIRVANRLFVERGIRGVRMDDVAAQLAMSKRTLYEMFHDKEGLLLACVRYQDEKKKDYIRELVSTTDNVLEIVFHLYRQGIQEAEQMKISSIRELHKFPLVCDYLVERRKENKDKAFHFYNLGIGQKLFRKDVNFEIFHMLMDMAMGGYINSENLDRYPLSEVFDTIMRVNMRGICTEKGQRLFDEFLEKQQSENK
ncbi:MAG: TetR/AcrR family transcriptional regulator [Bacteroidaceae bacterium]|nr:TetR/AcrR family transcriptional regulator [Bacteroidaceae bacterium]